MTAAAERTRTPAENPAITKTIVIPIALFPQGGRWYAASTEFVLMAEGHDEEEALMRFLEATRAYVISAMSNGWLDAMNHRPTFARRWEIRFRVLAARLLRRHPRYTNQTLSFA